MSTQPKTNSKRKIVRYGMTIDVDRCTGCGTPAVARMVEGSLLIDLCRGRSARAKVVRL